MRNPDGTLVGNLDDTIPAIISASLQQVSGSTLDENQTIYDLLPVVVNQPPIIVDPIFEISEPPIKTYSAVDQYGSEYMYLHSDGTVKANIGSLVRLRIKAEQPDTFNIDNGVPIIKKPDVELTYVWKFNGEVIQNQIKESLKNSIQVVNNTELRIDNLQPQNAGDYTCEVSNDAGTTISETVAVEVFNPDIDSFFYRNLIQNPFGKNGTDEWNASSDDFISKTFTKADPKDLKIPSRPELFGYNTEAFYPRPYQIDTDMIKGIDYTKDLGYEGSYFTRARFKYINKGGTHFVKAYQDIDLTDLQPFIKGGVFGVDGVRAIFSCYIGNAITFYEPTSLSVLPRDRAFCYPGASRISVENFVTAGKGRVFEKAYVTIEEFDKETRLISSILNNDGSITRVRSSVGMTDPWSRRFDKYYGRRYYVNDTLGLRTTSTGNAFDTTLFIADELVPDPKLRFTYGQHAEFNKVILDSLNPNTNKIRVTINFETEDSRLYDLHLNLLEESDEMFEYPAWQKVQPFGNFAESSENKLVWPTIRQDTAYTTSPRKEIVPLAGDPRVLVTGLNLSLIPIEKYNPQLTEYYTKKSLVLNNTKAQVTSINYNNSDWVTFRSSKLNIS